MAEGQGGGEKTEQATPRKREKARKEGQVPRSAEVATALSMLLFISIAYSYVAIGGRRLLEGSGAWLMHPSAASLTSDLAVAGLRKMLAELFLFLAPILGGALLLGVAGNIFQVGLMLNWELAGPKWNRLNPSNWLKRVFSSEFFVGLLKSLGKGIGFVSIAALALKTYPDELWIYAFRTPEGLLLGLRDVVYRVGWRIGFAMVVIAIADVFWTRYRHERELRMSKQEVKDEHKETEGRPEVRAAQRRRQRDGMAKSLSDRVGDATVVATNPTHYAVAVRYRPGIDETPVVTAKGKDHRAARIRTFADAHGVPIVRDPPTARALFALVKEGASVPRELFEAVAQLLVVVYEESGVPEEIEL